MARADMLCPQRWARQGIYCPNLQGRFVLEEPNFIRLFMPKLVSERIKKLREEIAEISEANRTQMHRRDGGAAADHERRLQRLQEILDELMTLTDWKKP